MPALRDAYSLVDTLKSIFTRKLGIGWNTRKKQLNLNLSIISRDINSRAAMKVACLSGANYVHKTAHVNPVISP